MAAMIGAPGGGSSFGTPSKLSIFADSIIVDEQDEDYTPDPIQAVKLVEDFILETKSLAGRQTLEKVVDGLDLGLDPEDGNGDGNGEDDLLDLMDSVS